MSQRINRKKRPTTNQKLKRRSKSVTNMLDQGGIINLNPSQWLLPETKDYLKPKPTSDTENEHKIEVVPIETKKIRTPYDEVKSYLRKNSLLAKGLTIFDVLYPTTMTVKDLHHVQVIDRYVLAKVWDDISPLAYGSFVGKLRLVNHYAVDLEKYEDNLRKLITNYHQFTSNFIWKYLSDEHKRKLGPSLHWNSLPKDTKNRITQEMIAKEEYTSQSALEIFAWGKLTENEQNDLLKNPASYRDNNQILLKNILKDTESELALKAVNRMDVEIHRAIKFLQISTDLRQLQKRADVDSKLKVEQKEKPKRKPTRDRSFGQHVICRFDDDGFFYSGTIRKNCGRSIIRFDMGIEQDAIGHILLPTTGAIAQPNLFINDCVLVRQMNGHREFWAPGIVIVLPSAISPPPLYTVQIYTPSAHQVHVYRRDMLKISLGLFQRTVLYLQSIDAPTPITDNGLQQSSFEKTLREGLEPLTTKVEHLHQSHNERYNKLKKALEDQMIALRNLQNGTSKPTVKYESSQTAEISLKPVIIKPEPPQRVPTPEPPIIIKPPIITNPPKDFIKPNTQVYVVCSDDDEFVYKGTVLKKSDEPDSHIVKRNDLPHNESIVKDDHILLQSACKRLETIESKFAIIKYPKDSRQFWRPAVIPDHDHKNSIVNVRFYDCIDKNISNKVKAIEIDKHKFQRYATSRIEFENSLIGHVIVGLNGETKTYLLGTIIKRIESGHKYIIRWCNDTESQQEEEHLFGIYANHNQHKIDDLVLAIDNDEYIYKPARIIGHSNDWKILTVRFLRPEEEDRESDVPAITTFVITEEYYEWMIETLYK